MGKKPGKKYVRPKTPGDLWTCSSYLARDLVPQYLQMGVISQTAAVALYIAAGVVEFGRKRKSFYEPPGKIARALGLPKNSIKTYLNRLVENGVVARNGKAGVSLNERPWSVPGLTTQSNQPSVSSVVNTTLETEKGEGGHNAYPDGDTPSSPGEETLRNPEGGTSCGLHLRESEEKESEEEKHIGKESPRAPSCVSRSSSFKKRSKAETQRFLKAFPWEDHQLDSPEGLASCWANLVVAWRKPSGAEAEDRNGSAAEVDPMEVSRAYMTLKQMRIYKTPETVRRWLEWYVKSGGLNRSDFITKFSKSWDKFVPIVAREFVDRLRAEGAEWGKELDERHRREAGRTMPIIRFNSDYGEDESERMRDSLRTSLPDDEAINGAIREQKRFYRDLFDDSNYMRWIASLAKAVPVLGPYTEVADTDRHLDFVRLAREDCDGDLDLFADQTRDYVAGQIKYGRDVIIDEGYVGPRMLVFYWLDYAYYFELAPGIEEILYPPDEAEGERGVADEGKSAS